MKKNSPKNKARNKRSANKAQKKKDKKRKGDIKHSNRDKKLQLPEIERVLCNPIVPDEKQAEGFKTLLTDGYKPAVVMLEECFSNYNDKDGNFIEQFQSTGFDSRTWELYLNTYLGSIGFTISNRYTSPDFVISKNELEVCIEAVTTNRSLEGSLANITNLDSMKTHFDFKAIKMGSSLWTKHQKKYWKLDQVKSKPLIFAIECFHEEGPFYSGDAPLIDYLYGKSFSWFFDDKNQLIVKNHDKKNHNIGEKEIPSGFFHLPESENISAVMFSNSGTIAKFNRMGKLKWPKCKVRMFRKGTSYNHDPNAQTPDLFEYEVGHENPKETWGEGLIMFHNPNAIHPVEQNLFPDIPHGKFTNGDFIVENMPTFHPLASTTVITRG